MGEFSKDWMRIFILKNHHVSVISFCRSQGVFRHVSSVHPSFRHVVSPRRWLLGGLATMGSASLHSNVGGATGRRNVLVEFSLESQQNCWSFGWVSFFLCDCLLFPLKARRMPYFSLHFFDDKPCSLGLFSQRSKKRLKVWWSKQVGQIF